MIEFPTFVVVVPMAFVKAFVVFAKVIVWIVEIVGNNQD